MQEAQWWFGLPDARPLMCPVLFYIPGGFLTAMRRAQKVDLDFWLEHGQEGYEQAKALGIPVENKWDSWGLLDGKPVAVDYGS